MRRRHVLIPQPTEQNPDSIDTLENILSLLIQISQLNKQLLEFVTLAHKSPSQTKQILPSLKNIRMSIDRIEDTYKQKITKIKELRFPNTQNSLLRRLVERVTERMYRKGVFHQKYNRYLPNNILLHKQILGALKTLMGKVEKGAARDLLDLVQILNTLQYENILLYKHLVNLFVENNVIESEEEIIRQIEVETGRERRESQGRDNIERLEEEFNFDEYIINSIIDLERESQSAANYFVVPRQVRHKVNGVEEEEPVIKRPSKVKMNQEIQAEILGVDVRSGGSEKTETPRSKIEEVEVIDRQLRLPTYKEQGDQSEMAEKHLSLISIHNTQTSQQQSTNSIKKYILNKPARSQPKAKKPQNLTPITKVKLTLKEDHNFILEKQSGKSQVDYSQDTSEHLKTNESVRRVKKSEFRQHGLKYRNQHNQSLTHFTKPSGFEKPMTVGNSKNNSIHAKQYNRTATISVNNPAKAKSARETAKEEIPIRGSADTQDPPLNQHIALNPVRGQSQHQAQKLKEIVFERKGYGRADDLSNILSCNSYIIYESKHFRKTLQRERSSICKCKEEGHSHNEPKTPRKLLNNLMSESKKQEVKEIGYRSLADFENILATPTRSKGMKVPTYYSSGKRWKDKVLERDPSRQLEEDREQRDSILMDIANVEARKTALYSDKKMKGSSLKKSSVFKKSKEQLFEVYSPARKELL